MRFDNKVIDSILIRVFVAVMCILVCCGVGRSMTAPVLSIDSVSTFQDSLISEMVEFIQPIN